MGRSAWVLLGAAALAVAGCSSSGSGGNGLPAPTSAAASGTGTVVQVVAAENFWGDITSQIGGAHAKVTSLVTDPNADPHQFETDPRDVALISKAQLVVVNGAGYDDWATKVLAAGSSDDRTVVTVSDVVGVKGSNPNPHLWYSPTYVPEAANAIEAQLAKADPADAATFQANLKTFLTGYAPYAQTIADIKKKYAGVKISYTERVPGYLVDAAGLVLGTPAAFSQAVEDGTDPGPGDTANFDHAISDHSVKVLLYNSQVTDAETDHIKSLAAAANVPIVGVSETMPKALHFQAWQIAQARAVLTALGG